MLFTALCKFERGVESWFEIWVERVWIDIYDISLSTLSDACKQLWLIITTARLLLLRVAELPNMSNVSSPR